jgi:hypothetical protein
MAKQQLTHCLQIMTVLPLIPIAKPFVFVSRMAPSDANQRTEAAPVKDTLTGGTLIKGKARQNREPQSVPKHQGASCDWRNGGTHGHGEQRGKATAQASVLPSTVLILLPCFWLPASYSYGTIKHSKSTLDSPSPLLCPLGRNAARKTPTGAVYCAAPARRRVSPRLAAGAAQ